MLFRRVCAKVNPTRHNCGLCLIARRVFGSLQPTERFCLGTQPGQGCFDCRAVVSPRFYVLLVCANPHISITFIKISNTELVCCSVTHFQNTKSARMNLQFVTNFYLTTQQKVN